MTATTSGSRVRGDQQGWDAVGARILCLDGSRGRASWADASSPCPRARAEVRLRRIRFSPDVIIVAVRWYLRYRLSYRGFEELLANQGTKVNRLPVVQGSVQRHLRQTTQRNKGGSARSMGQPIQHVRLPCRSALSCRCPRDADAQAMPSGHPAPSSRRSAATTDTRTLMAPAVALGSQGDPRRRVRLWTNGMGLVFRGRWRRLSAIPGVWLCWCMTCRSASLASSPMVSVSSARF